MKEIGAKNAGLITLFTLTLGISVGAIFHVIFMILCIS
jgi:hypothetical protein